MTHVHPRPDAPFQEKISCQSPAVSPSQTSGNFLSHLSELISQAAARLPTIRMGTVIRPTLIPANDYTWTSMLQLQAILLAAKLAIDVISNGALKKDLQLARQLRFHQATPPLLPALMI